MAAPAVFVSSTFYDLRYIRGNIRYFVTGLGYRPVLNEEGAIYYDPTQHVLDAALAEIPNCQMFVLVIGGRHGTDFHDTDHSITNAEYKEAVKLKIPIFALVEQGVYSDFQVWRANRSNEALVSQVEFPNTDDIRVFGFIDEVQGQAVNNALVPFRDWSDIESYLRQQWAGMMHSFLTIQSHGERVEDSLEMLADVNQRIEMLSTQILKSVGTSQAKAVAQMYARMLDSNAMDDLKNIGAKPRPSQVLDNETFDDFAEAVGTPWRDPPPGEDLWISSSGEIDPYRRARSAADYERLKVEIQRLLDEAAMTIDELREEERADISLTGTRNGRRPNASVEAVGLTVDERQTEAG